MEVGKLIMNTIYSKAHMTLSVKPFGCMPSAGVSDGVQSAISEKFPGTIFCPVETSGDGRVNFYSRVQMYLFKAKQAAAAELERACAEHGVTKEQVQALLDANPRYASSSQGAACARATAPTRRRVAPVTKTPWALEGASTARPEGAAPWRDCSHLVIGREHGGRARPSRWRVKRHRLQKSASGEGQDERLPAWPRRYRPAIQAGI
jgi:hypothetical protein